MRSSFPVSLASPIKISCLHYGAKGPVIIRTQQIQNPSQPCSVVKQRMSVSNLDLNILPEDGRLTYGYDYTGYLYKEELLVSPIAVRHVPIALPHKLHFSRVEHASLYPLGDLPSFELQFYRLPPSSLCPDQRHEWKKFLTFLYQRDKVVLIPIEGWELIIKPPTAPPDERSAVRVCYRKISSNRASLQQTFPTIRQSGHGREMIRPRGEVLDPPVRGYDISKSTPFSGVVPLTPTLLVQPRLGLMHPSYLQTLGQTHASWQFGGIAELVDNARDAGATRLNISISMMKMKGSVDIIPILCVDDNGKGMTHKEIVRMLSFGHSTPTGDNKDCIGHFGVGFKTGAMRIGRDVVVLTQSKCSRSIGLLSSSYNADKEVLEVPIVTYRKIHGVMELDLSVQSEAEGEACLAAVKKYSPFSEFEIGSLFEKIGNGETASGTQILIYNLDKWGSQYAFQWEMEESNSRDQKQCQKDIIIRSKRVRSRVGQTCKDIPLDYSLRSYLEVLFLEPRMTIRIQGSRVKTTRLAVSLNTTQVSKGNILSKQVELTLGRSHFEHEKANCGIFLYWHGRLIEAYKRVGGMVHSADMGRGVIGVIDVSNLMDKLDGKIGVLNTKQGFEDCEEYALLEKWLAQEFNEYWYKYFDNLEVVRTNVEDGEQFEPDQDWVQCDKCRKWRKLPRGQHSQDLPEEWFCYMEPFNKTCKEGEEKVDESIVTVGVNRTSMPPKPTIMTTPKVVSPTVENLEDDIEDGPLPAPVRKQPTRKNVQFASPLSPTPVIRTGVSTLGKVDGKRDASESLPKRRLRRRS